MGSQQSHTGHADVRITAPDHSLRDKIGRQVALEKIFTPERIQACQEIVNAAYADIFREVLAGIAEMEKDYAQMVTHPADADAYIEHITRLSFSVKKKMENLGLAFGSEISKSLHDYVCSLPDYNVRDVNIPLVLRKHIDILHARFMDDAQTSSDDMEREILASLTAMVKKMRG